jgi:hypothetical protein
LHAVIVKTQEQLLARERELDSRESTIIAWEEGLTSFARPLDVVSTERDTSRARIDAIQWDFLTQVCASISQSR